MNINHIAYEFRDNKYYFERPEIFVSDISGQQVAFMVVYQVSPNYLKTCYNILSHNSFELQCIDAGYVETYINSSKKLILEEDDILLLPPNILHQSLSDPALFSRYCINFHISFSNKNMIKQSPNNSIFSHLKNEIVFKNEEIRRCIKKIYELSHEDINQIERAKVYLQLIFLEAENEVNKLIGNNNANRSETPILSTQVNNYRMWLIDIYISNYYMCKNHTEILSSVLSLSPRQTLRVVEELTGQHINDLVLNQRMNVAINALNNTELSMKQISEMVGYETYSGFYIAFKKYFGRSPEELRGYSDSDL